MAEEIIIEGAYEALLNIQRELKVAKSNYNNFGGFSYRSKEDILEAVKPLAHKYGCTVEMEDNIEYIEGRFYCKSRAILQHIDSESYVYAHGWAREPEHKKGADDSQVTGMACSYAGKRALGNLFAIDDTEDADAQEQQEEKPAQKPKNAQQSQNPAQGEQDIETRIENGIQALIKVSGMTREDIMHLMDRSKLNTPNKRLEWLTNAYKQSVAEV